MSGIIKKSGIIYRHRNKANRLWSTIFRHELIEAMKAKRIEKQ